MLGLAHYLRIEDDFGIKFPSVEYSNRTVIDGLLETLRRENQILMDLFQFEPQSTELVDAKQYEVEAYQLIQGMTSSLSFVFSEIKNPLPAMAALVKKSLNYIFANEYQLTKLSLKAQLDGFSPTLFVIGNQYAIWYCALTGVILTLGLVNALVVMGVERLNAVRDNQMEFLIKGISNRDREAFTSSINGFVRRLIVSKRHDYMSEDICTRRFEDSQRFDFRGTNLSIRVSMLSNAHCFGPAQDSPSNSNSPFQMSNNSSQVASPSAMRSPGSYLPSNSFSDFRGYASSSRLVTRQSGAEDLESHGGVQDEKEGDDREMERNVPIVPIRSTNKVLYVATLLLFAAGASVCVYAILNSMNKAFFIGSFTTNIMLLFSEPVIYCEEVEFFMQSTRQNFANITAFIDIYNERKAKDINSLRYNGEIMNSECFDSFNAFYSRVKFNSICSYADCSPANSSLTTLQTEKLKYSEYMYQTATYYHSAGGANLTELLAQPIFSSLVSLTFLSISVNNKMLAMMVEGIKCKINSDHYKQAQLYDIQKALLLVFFVLVALPYLVYSVKNWRRSRNILEIIDEDNYEKAKGD